MKTEFALIPKENIEKAKNFAAILHNSVEAGEMSVVDDTVCALKELMDKNYSITLDDGYWHEFLAKIRKLDKNFKSEYLLKKSHLQTIISVGMKDSVSEKIYNIIEQAIATDGVVLQLPCLEENSDVR